MKLSYSSLLIPLALSATACQNPYSTREKPIETPTAIVKPKEITTRSTTDEMKSAASKLREDAKTLVRSINPDTTSITQGRNIDAKAKMLESLANNYDKMTIIRTKIVEGCKKTRLLLNGNKVEKFVTPATDPLVQACVEAKIAANEVYQQNQDVIKKVKNSTKQAQSNVQTVNSVKN